MRGLNEGEVGEKLPHISGGDSDPPAGGERHRGGSPYGERSD